MTPTIGDLISFILLNRSDRCFIGMSELDIARLVDRKIRESMLWYTIDDNSISGMIIATNHVEPKIIYIDQNLAMNKNNLKKFARRAKTEFEGYRLEWEKNGKHILVTNTEKLYAKLS